MQRLSYPTETVLSDKITRNRIVPSFKDSPRKPLRRRPFTANHTFRFDASPLRPRRRRRRRARHFFGRSWSLGLRQPSLRVTRKFPNYLSRSNETAHLSLPLRMALCYWKTEDRVTMGRISKVSDLSLMSSFSLNYNIRSFFVVLLFPGFLPSFLPSISGLQLIGRELDCRPTTGEVASLRASASGRQNKTAARARSTRSLNPQRNVVVLVGLVGIAAPAGAGRPEGECVAYVSRWPPHE